ncbi:Preprotein translocase secY subunit (TC 3.A.5.1.1) [Alloactinosynnema sp. L-07]|uniref:preprotein translocase subunit SecY n=1 Tax=Alloactinosynnema sp. L-07 TaxID=1653480 RepID=UPI00065EF852|nr:hypothetical protein [Alloactinosynnema sp. L-07]CRK58279.1 Preprotein translocase secY subunit (TC 3.A.5.1.1) [Alloactinosynnema sp. L-07]
MSTMIVFRAGSPLRRLAVTLLAVVIFRVGQNVPLPTVDLAANSVEDDSPLYWVIDLLTGGGFRLPAVIAFGVLPVLVARVLMRNLVPVIPRLSALAAEGEAGTARIARYTRVLAVVLGGAGVVAAGIGDRGAIPLVVMAATAAAGTALAILLAELITKRGYGDGVRILLLTQVLAVAAVEFWRLVQAKGVAAVIVALVVVVVVVMGTILVAQVQRRIPVQYAKRLIGRRTHGGTPTYVPVQMAQRSGPIVLAAVVLAVPALPGLLWSDATWLSAITAVLWDEADPVRMVAYAVLVGVFAYARSAATSVPTTIASKLVREGGFIPGIRPGNPTAQYLEYVDRRMNAAGALYLGAVALLPEIAIAVLDAAPRFPFAGVAILVSLIFVVDVALTTAKQVETQLQMIRYQGYLR